MINDYKPFDVEITPSPGFKVGEVIRLNSRGELWKILKVYKTTWFKRLLVKIGFDCKMEGTYKVVHFNPEKYIDDLIQKIDSLKRQTLN